MSFTLKMLGFEFISMVMCGLPQPVDRGPSVWVARG
jgi:hypothetical protein